MVENGGVVKEQGSVEIKNTIQNLMLLVLLTASSFFADPFQSRVFTLLIKERKTSSFWGLL